MSFDPDLQPLVLDNGSGLMKVGLGGDDCPRAVFPSIVGRPKNPGFVAMDAKDCFVGDEAQAKRGILKLKYPIEQGLVTNWNDMEKIWHHAFFEELVGHIPEETPVFLTESPFAPKRNREKRTTIMFETFNVVALYNAVGEVLAPLCVGRTSGLVLSSGDTVTHVVPVYEGHAISHACQKLGLGGRDVIFYLIKLMNDRGHDMTSSAEFEIVRDIKETRGYIALDYDEEMMEMEAIGDSEVEYELPDGTTMPLASERFRAPELLFKPSLIDAPNAVGIPQLLADAIESVDADLQNLMYGNVMLCGGSTMFEGMTNRIEKEVRRLALASSSGTITPAEVGVQELYRNDETKFAVWLGGSILSSLSSFRNCWITKEEYDDVGSMIVHRKCW